MTSVQCRIRTITKIFLSATLGCYLEFLTKQVSKCIPCFYVLFLDIRGEGGGIKSLRLRLVEIDLILHYTDVVWPGPHDRHSVTSVWKSSPVSVWFGSGLACPWPLNKCCPNAAQAVLVSSPCTKSCDRQCLVSSTAGQNNQNLKLSWYFCVVGDQLSHFVTYFFIA